MISICLLGQKDHGKSTLIGRLLYDTKSIEQDRINEVKAASEREGKTFDFAFLLDSFEEERSGEFTLDTIELPLKWNNQVYGLIDVPGHRELIKNMLTGSSRARYAILIVSVEDGIQQQTREHLHFAGLLGIERVIVVVNKMDAIQYDQERFTALANELKTLIADAGIQSHHIIPLSAREGDNVSRSSPHLRWYQGPPLLDLIVKECVPPTPHDGPLRIPVQGVYPKGDTRIIMGKIEQGNARKGGEVLIVPGNATTTVSQLIVASQEREEATSGENVGMVVADDITVERGMLVAAPAPTPETVSSIDGRIMTLDAVEGDITVSCGTASVPATIEAVQLLTPTQATITLQRPLVVEKAGPLSRFVLLKNDVVVGIGNRR